MNKVLEYFDNNTYYSVKSGNVTFEVQNTEYWEFQRLLTNQSYELEEKDEELEEKDYEIEKIKNIIDELEKHLIELRLTDIDGRTIVYRLLDKLKELKGNDKDE